MILSIVSFEKVPDESHYIFHLNVQYEDWDNTISKRYSEFLELHRVMNFYHIQLIRKSLVINLRGLLGLG